LSLIVVVYVLINLPEISSTTKSCKLTETKNEEIFSAFLKRDFLNLVPEIAGNAIFAFSPPPFVSLQ
jgi:hypothetical protein